MSERFSLLREAVETIADNLNAAHHHADVIAKADPTFDVADIARQIDEAVRLELIRCGCPEREVPEWLATIRATARHRRSLEDMIPEGHA